MHLRGERAARQPPLPPRPARKRSEARAPAGQLAVDPSPRQRAARQDLGVPAFQALGGSRHLRRLLPYVQVTYGTAANQCSVSSARAVRACNAQTSAISLAFSDWYFCVMCSGYDLPSICRPRWPFPLFPSLLCYAHVSLFAMLCSGMRRN
jgi:hypothetical protein